MLNHLPLEMASGWAKMRSFASHKWALRERVRLAVYCLVTTTLQNRHLEPFMKGFTGGKLGLLLLLLLPTFYSRVLLLRRAMHPPCSRLTIPQCQKRLWLPLTPIVHRSVYDQPQTRVVSVGSLRLLPAGPTFHHMSSSRFTGGVVLSWRIPGRVLYEH